MSETRTQLAADIRRIVLEQSKRANVGHIGSCLSIVEIVAALYDGTLRHAGSDDPDRDRFVLSKGHAALTQYAALQATGRIGTAELDAFCSDGTPLGAHPEHSQPGIDFSTGSLGQGLSIGVGAALAARRQGSDRRVFVIVSDAECNEGSLWEAVMFAAHHGLGNLIAIVDANGQQALGYTREVIDLAPLGDKWRAFGWDVHDVDGHDVPAMQATIAGLDSAGDQPHVLVADTTFGRGVGYMESQIAWHYWPMDDDQYAEALQDLEAAEGRA